MSLGWVMRKDVLVKQLYQGQIQEVISGEGSFYKGVKFSTIVKEKAFLFNPIDAKRPH